MNISLRAARPSDADYVYRLVDVTMREYVKQLFGQINEERSRNQVVEQIAAGMYSIVAANGGEVGAIAVEREPTHIQLTQLYIDPLHQNRGIGTWLVRRVIEEAKAAGKPVRLRVLSVNPARRLYEREGFRVTSQTPERYFMEWFA